MATAARVALCRGKDAPLTIEDVELDELRPDELRVRIVASGICHTDIAVKDEQIPVPLPIVLGHEGAGIVETVGSAVTVAAPGDRVIMSFNSCGNCPECAAHLHPYCSNFHPHNWSGTRADGTPTMTKQGTPVNANFFGQSSFATHAIAHQANTVKIPASAAHIPLEQLAPVGCGMMTGAGAVLRSMKVRPGTSIAVFGTGSVGLAAVMASKIAGAITIIAVDTVDARLELAKELGATHAFNAEQDAIGAIRDMLPEGIDYAFDTTGINRVIEDAWGLLGKKGICGMVGASDRSAELTLNQSAFLGGGRTLMGILGGDSDIGPFCAELIEHHVAGRFPFDKLIGYFAFDQINEAIHASETGEVVKPVLRISEE